MASKSNIKFNRLSLAMIATAGLVTFLVETHGKIDKNLLAETTSDVHVVDGDTLVIKDERIRLWGIDAPELHQICSKDKKEVQCGEMAKLALMALVKSGPVECVKVNTDQYHRSVSRCTIDTLDIGRLLVMSGWALNYQQYSKGYYQQWEDEAHKDKHGIWAMTFTNPWEWRKGDRRYK
ncbi:MAG TPA: thermonuclease family protein [Puia sp.]